MLWWDLGCPWITAFTSQPLGNSAQELPSHSRSIMQQTPDTLPMLLRWPSRSASWPAPVPLHHAVRPLGQRLPEDSWDFSEALAGFTFVSALHFTKYDTAKAFFFSVPAVLMLRVLSGLVNSIANFPWQDSFTLQKLKAEHVESPDLAF